MALARELLLPPDPGTVAGVAVERIEDLPEDAPPIKEGDDSVHWPDASRSVRRSKTTEVVKPTILNLAPVRYVPFTRVLRPGKSAGRDVVAVQRALQRAGYRKLRPSGYFGPAMKKQLQKFQHDHSVGATGNYGRPTHTKMLAYFDAYGASLMQAWVASQSATAHRHEVVSAALFGVAHRSEIDYTQGPSRMDGVKFGLRPPKFPRATDCSGFATWCYFVPKLDDPSDSAYSLAAPHYTGSLSQHGKEVKVAEPGDLIIYGSGWPYSHVTIAIDRDKCVSHGSPPGPMILPIHYRDDLVFIRSYLPR